MINSSGRILIFFLGFLVVRLANAELDKEAICRSRISQDIQRAQWGIGMREEMFKNCKNKNINVCAKPYISAIQAQSVKDDKALQAYFDNHQVGQAMRFIMLTDNIAMWKAATAGLKEDGLTADDIANQNYHFCLGTGR